MISHNMFRCGPCDFETTVETDWHEHRRTVQHPETKIKGWCTQCHVVRININHDGAVDNKHIPGMCEGCEMKAYNKVLAKLQAAEQGGQE